MENFLLIAVCLGLGVLLRSYSKFPKDAHLGVNGFIVFVSLPAIVFKYIPNVEFSSEILLPFSASWLVWLGAYVFFKVLGKWRNWPTDLTVVLILLGGLGNTSFVGFPLVSAWFGADQISIALFADQGSFLVMATLGIGIASQTQTTGFDIKKTIKQLLIFPPFSAFILAMGLKFISLPEEWFFVMDQLSAPLIPLALVSIGLQLNFKEKFTEWRYLGIGLFYKLLIAPMIVFVVMRFIVKDTTIFSEIAVFESAMAPMVTAFIIASQYNLKPKLAGMLVGIGIPLSLFTTAAWYALLNYF